MNSKTTPESIRIHESFIISLKASKKLKASLKSSSIKLKSPPKFCPFSFEINCDNTLKYSQIDGSCNNLGSSMLGKSSTPFKRFMKTAYDDGMNDPRRTAIDGSPLPNPRSIALMVHDPLDSPTKISHLGVMFGQFIDHDFAQSAATGSGSTALKCTCDSRSQDCVNIPTPENADVDSDQQCMILTRSAASFDKFDCTLGAREQTNLQTHWLDLSQLYGSDSAQQSKLRAFSGGKLKTSSINEFSGREFLPLAQAGMCVDETNEQLCFESGDSRTSQNMMLVSIHTVWLREHNRLTF
jgi:peroxidase